MSCATTSSEFSFHPISMSKWTKLVSISLMLMMVITQLAVSIEGKSLYQESQHEGSDGGTAGGIEHSPSTIFGLEKSGGRGSNNGGLLVAGDAFDFGDSRNDDYEVAGSVPLDNAAFLNYLYTRQMLQRLKPVAAAAVVAPQFVEQPSFPFALQQDPIRKRTSTYWKQCAFNAVSCFGRRK